MSLDIKGFIAECNFLIIPRVFCLYYKLAVLYSKLLIYVAMRIVVQIELMI